MRVFHFEMSPSINYCFFFLFFFYFLFIYDCVGSSFLCEGFLQPRQAGTTLHRGAQASHYRGLSCCGAQAPDAQAQQSWLTGPVAPRHAGSPQTRARTRVPCIGRQTLNHCATREAQIIVFYVCSEHVLGVINLLSSLGRMWVSCHHCFIVWGHVLCFSCMVLLLSKPAFLSDH